MFWVMMAVLVVVGAILLRRKPVAVEEEPWRVSLREDGDDEPLDIDEIRRAEDEWLAEEESEEGWRGVDDDEEWR